MKATTRKTALKSTPQLVHATNKENTRRATNMNIVVLNRWAGEIIVEGEYDDIKSLVNSNPGINLTEADLRGADLTEADLTRANLRGANLRGAYLRLAQIGRAHV